MAEVTQASLMSSLIAKGNEVISLAKQVYIFRASIAYVIQHLHSFITSLKNTCTAPWSDEQIQACRQIQDLFNHLASLLPHLSADTWIQPALNWPADYVHKYIAGFRQSLITHLAAFSLNPTTVIVYNEEQDNVNQRSDLQNLKSSLQELMAQVDTSDAVGVQQQIETKLSEIKRLLPQDQKHNNPTRRPSCDSFPIVQMKKRVEELLLQFKSINISTDDLQKQNQIGAGGFGTVYKAIRFSTGEVVAVKELRTDRLTMSSWASLYAEVESMASVRHPFVLELVGAHITEPYQIITRFCSGKSLFDRLHRSTEEFPILSSTQLTRIAYEVASGMAYLHKMGIVHRDLKTLNILLDDDGDSCVADFGLSGMMKDNQELVGGVGTPHYTAPEVLMHTKYGPRVDTFSYGVVLWEMLMRKVPYADMSHMQIYEHVVTRGWRLPIPNDTPDGLKKLITRCWSKNANDRPFFDEIVELFEKGTAFFQGSEKIDFNSIKTMHRCPPIDSDFCNEVLSNPSHPHFSSVAYFISSNIDPKTRSWLRQKKFTDAWVKASDNFDAILILSGEILEEDEFECFMNNGGLTLFKTLINTSRGQSITAAVKFALRLPKDQLSIIRGFLPKIVEFMSSNSGTSTQHILQLLARFSGDELSQFVPQIQAAILDVGRVVDDQATFDSIVSLLPMCRNSVSNYQLLSLYHLLTAQFVVPSSFAELLINASDSENKPLLVFNLLQASQLSDIDAVLIQFLQACLKDDAAVFKKVSKMRQLYQTLQDLIQKDHLKLALFFTFCICSDKETAIELSASPLLAAILSLRTHIIQRLQIATALTLFEDFCIQTTHMDGIIHLLVSSLSSKEYVNDAVHLLGAMSSHSTGCSILGDNGVLELFAQLFLSSSSGESSISLTILRNVAENGGEIPQVSLIVSCLMQDLVYDSSRRRDIMETLVSLVTIVPGCVQEHDLQRIILSQLSLDQPQLVFLSLQLFSICDVTKLRGFYPEVLSSIHHLFSTKEMLYPEIINAGLMAISSIGSHYDLSDFVSKTCLEKFVGRVISLLPADSPFNSKMQDLLGMILRRQPHSIIVPPTNE